PKRGAAPLINKANDGIAIDGSGNGLTKFYFAKPFLLGRHFRGGFFSKIVQIEKEKVEFETRASIGHGVAALLPGEDRKIIRTKAGNDISFTRLKAQDLCVGARDKEKNQLVQIGKTISFGI